MKKYNVCINTIDTGDAGNGIVDILTVLVSAAVVVSV